MTSVNFQYQDEKFNYFSEALNKNININWQN